MKKLICLSMIVMPFAACTKKQAQNSSVLSLTSDSVSSSCALKPIEVNDYNLIVFSNINHINSDTQGRVTIGGDARFVKYSVADQLTANPDRYDLVVGGNLYFEKGAVENRRAIVGDDAELIDAVVNVDKGSFLDFVKLKNDFLSSSEFLKQQNINVSYSSGSILEIFGSDPIVNKVVITQEELAAASVIKIDAPESSKVIVEVSGTSPSSSEADFQLSGVLKENVTWHFPDAQNITLFKAAVLGNILAPNASFEFNEAKVVGQVVVDRLDGNGQIDLNKAQDLCSIDWERLSEENRDENDPAEDDNPTEANDPAEDDNPNEANDPAEDDNPNEANDPAEDDDPNEANDPAEDDRVKEEPKSSDDTFGDDYNDDDSNRYGKASPSQNPNQNK